MPWVKIDDQFSDHPKVIDAGPLAECLFVRGLTYASRYLTDGFIPASHLRRMGDMDAIEEAGRLVAVGLWHEADGGYRIHDYLDYNPSAEKVKADREAARERMGKARSGKPKPNNQPRSPEVRANFAGSSDNPVPGPVPDQEVPDGTSSSSADAAGNGDDEEPKPKSSRKKPSAPIPDDFTPTSKRIEWAVNEGLSEPEARHEFRKFQSHAEATDRRMVDWEATWRTWVLKAVGDRQQRAGSLTVHRGGKVGRDGKTDEERGWRENPGPKGWSADEMMRMSMAMEQAERERTSA